MVAAEFGVVDIEAGQKAEPEKKVTREFAAHTLNYCLGYKLEGDGGYTFSDIADCQSQYQDDAQIAVNRGWFTLVDGKFMPGQDITAAEAEQMLADAASVLKESEVDAGAAGNYTFADDVRVIPEGTDVSIDENDIVTINGTAGADVKEGETFVVYPADFPCLYKAVTVEKSQDTVVITTEEADEDTAIKSVQSEGIADADLSQFESAENMEATYVETKKQARAASSTYGIQVTKDSIIADTKIPLGNGLSVKVAVNLSDLKIPHKIDSMNGYYYVELKGNVAVTGTLSADLIEMGGVSKDVKIGQIRIAGVGVIEVTLHFSAEGRIIVTYSGGFGAGFQSSGSDFRLLTSFKKKSFASTVEAEASIGLKASAGIDLLIVKGSAYLESGMSWHFEDRRLVMSCTRGKDYSYFTNSLSRYGSSCFGDGSSTGFDEEWKPYTIYTYDLDEDGNATITSYKGNVGVLIIPDTLDGHKVAGIGKGAFKNCILQVVVIPDTVVTIGEEAFAESANLRSVEIGNSVTKIENDAFRRDKKLTEITIPDSVTKMGSGVFGECEGLSRVKLSKSLKGIGAFAFYYCDRLAEIEIPKNLEETKNAYYLNP